MRILLVDDEQTYLRLLGDVLQDYGHTVITASDGKQACERLECENPDLIISDVFMPLLDGARFYSFVREQAQNRSVPFIFVSGFDDETTRGLARDPHIDFFFSKTAPIEDIITFVNSLDHVTRTNPA